MVQMALCDSSHTFPKQITNVSHHVFVNLLWGIAMFPLTNIKLFVDIFVCRALHEITHLRNSKNWNERHCKVDIVMSLYKIYVRMLEKVIFDDHVSLSTN